jgi:sugar O-acyltransferase (sialic acid O-acetyltransferase NeuD family)|tara:strand:+ start:371 stop:1015 length:645 start_codon:yes stop_codon:yes gene_type:complete
MSKPVIIIGAGGHAKVVANILKLSRIEVLGVVTPDLNVGSYFLNLKVLGDDSVIFDYAPAEIELVNGVGALPHQNIRLKLTQQMTEKAYVFAKVTHPTAIIAKDVVLDEGSQIMAGVIIQPGTMIGKNTIINSGSIIDHDCRIAENCHIAPGVVCSGGVNIEKNVHIGTGTSIIQNIKIGEGSIIAAGSIVYKDVATGMVFKNKLNSMMEVIGN